MSGEPADAGQETASPGNTEPDQDRVQTAFAKALRDLRRLRGVPASDALDMERQIYNGVPWEVVAPLLTAIPIYSKTFLETLAKHNAEWLINAVRTRIRKNGRTRELVVGPENGAAATLVITASTPDEARLALLDLDVTAPELRGKELRWDEEAAEWRSSEALAAEPSDAGDGE